MGHNTIHIVVDINQDGFGNGAYLKLTASWLGIQEVSYLPLDSALPQDQLKEFAAPAVSDLIDSLILKLDMLREILTDLFKDCEDLQKHLN